MTGRNRLFRGLSGSGRLGRRLAQLLCLKAAKDAGPAQTIFARPVSITERHELPFLRRVYSTHTRDRPRSRSQFPEHTPVGGKEHFWLHHARSILYNRCP